MALNWNERDDRLRELNQRMRAPGERERLRPTPARTEPELPVSRPAPVAEGAERTAKLNAAYSKRSEAVARFQDAMRNLRAVSHKAVAEERVDAAKEWSRLLFAVASERDPEKRLDLQLQLDGAKERRDAVESNAEIAKDAEAYARDELKRSLAEIDAEIAELGGRLTVAPERSR